MKAFIVITVSIGLYVLIDIADILTHIAKSLIEIQKAIWNIGKRN